MADTTNRPPGPQLPVVPVALGVDKSIPVRPVALGVGNVVTIAAGTAFAIAGTGGLAAVAGVVAVGAGALVGRHARRRRHTTGRVFGSAGGRRSGRWSGLPSFRPGRGLLAAGRSTGATRAGTAGGRTPTARAASGSRMMPRTPTATPSRSAPRSTGVGVPRPTPASATRAAGATAPGTSAWRHARRAGHEAARIARATRDGVRESLDPRAAAAAARAKARGRKTNARWIRVVSGWAAGGAAYLGAAVRNALLLVFGTEVAHATVVRTPPANTARQPVAKVGKRLREQTADTPATPTTGGTQMSTTNAKSPLPAMIAMAEDINLLLGQFDPDGMLPVLAAYEKLPEFLSLMARMMKTLSMRAQVRYPLDPQILDLIDGLYRNANTQAKTAELIAPMIKSLHGDRLEALNDDRNAMWDHRANAEHR